MNGSIKFYNAEKGFGFITPDDGSQDVFFHITQCDEMYELPQEGDEVSFELGEGRDGRPAAENVQLVTSADEVSGDEDAGEEDMAEAA